MNPKTGKNSSCQVAGYAVCNSGARPSAWTLERPRLEILSLCTLVCPKCHDTKRCTCTNSGSSNQRVQNHLNTSVLRTSEIDALSQIKRPFASCLHLKTQAFVVLVGGRYATSKMHLNGHESPFSVRYGEISLYIGGNNN